MTRARAAWGPLLLGAVLMIAGTGYLTPSVGLGATRAGASAGLVGLLMSAYYAGYVLGGSLCPPLVRRVGRLRTLSAMAALVSAAAAGHALLPQLAAWVALRAATGVAVLGLYLVLESWLAAAAPPAARGRLFALYMLLAEASLGAGQLLLFVDADGDTRAFAVVGLLLCLGLVPAVLTRVREPEIEVGPSLTLASLARVAPIGAMGTTIGGGVGASLFSLGAVFALQVGLSAEETATFLAATVFSGIALQYPVGLVADRVDRRWLLAALAAAGALAAGGVMAAVGGPASGILLTGAAFGGLTFPLYALCVAITHDQLDSEQVLPATRGLLVLYGLGAAAGPLLGGLLLQEVGPRGLFGAFAGVLALLAGAALLRARWRALPPDVEPEPFVPMMQTSAAVAGWMSAPEDDQPAPPPPPDPDGA